MTNQRHQNARDDEAAQRGIATGLPPFMDGHILVTFQREANAHERMAARNDLTDRERDLTEKLDLQNESGGDYPTDDVAVVDSVEKADGVTSIARFRAVEKDGASYEEAMHRPVLDIDFPATLIPSATPGHFHLYLDIELPHHEYMFLLNALAEVGIIEPGYNLASQQRGYSSARLPTKPKVVA